MALPSVPPPGAPTFARTLDPQEDLDFGIPCDTLLEAGEAIDDFLLTLYPEALAFGLQIVDPTLIDGGREIDLRFTIDVDMQFLPAFDGTTQRLPIDVYFETTSAPPRKRNRTVYLPVTQL